MTFSTESLKRNTRRSTLARINPARYVGGSLTSEGGGIYSLLSGLVISGIQRNGTALTRVYSDPPTVNDNYYFNETTKEIVMKLASAPHVSTNVIVAYHYLFFTSGIKTDYKENPDLETGELRYWSPRLSDDFRFSSELSGLEVGTVSIPDATIEVLDADNTFNQYIGDEDSFFNKVIDLYQDLNGLIRKAYSGRIFAIDLSNFSAVISFTDQLSLLDKTAYMGDTFEQCFHTSAVPRKDLFKPIRLYLCRLSKYFDLQGSSSYAVDFHYFTSGESAVCSNYTNVISTSNNRVWTLGRIRGDLETQGFGTLQAVISPGYLEAFFRFSAPTNLNVGDTIVWSEGGLRYGIIVSTETFVHSSVTYNCAVKSSRASLWATPTLAAVMIEYPSVTIGLRDTDGIYKFPFYGYDYTLIQTTQQNTDHKVVKVSLSTSFESNLGILATIDPELVDIQFRLSSNADSKHGTVLKKILEQAGCSVNAASFTDANTALADNTNFFIPFINDPEYGSYLQYAQKILESTLGYLKQNDANELEYHLLSAPSPTDSRNTSHFMSDSDVAIDVEYRDIITEIVPHNEHMPVISVVDGTERSAKAKFLHGTIKSYKFEHVLQADSLGKTGRLSALLAIRSNRRKLIRYQTETIDLPTSIGDEQTLETLRITGGESDVMVTGTNKSENSTTVTTTDLLGL